MIRETFRKVASWFRPPKKLPIVWDGSTIKIYEKKFDTTELDKWKVPVTRSNFITSKEKHRRRVVNAMQRASRRANR